MTAFSVGPDPGPSLADAERALRRYKRVAAQIAEVETTAAELTLQAQEWCDAEMDRLQPQLDEHRQWLAAWLLARLEADPGAPKTVRLPSGEVRSRAGSLRVEVDDEAALVAFLEERGLEGALRPWRPPDVIPPPKVDKTALRGLLDGLLAPSGDPDKPGAVELVECFSGEVLPGVKLIRDERSITVVVEP